MSYLSGGGSGASTSVMNRSLFGATPGGGFFPPGSGSPPPSNNAPSPNLVLGQVKTVLNRSSVMSLSDKIYDLNKNLTWALPHLSTKDLDQIFVLLVGDIFGSHAVASSKYGQGGF